MSCTGGTPLSCREMDLQSPQVEVHSRAPSSRTPTPSDVAVIDVAAAAVHEQPAHWCRYFLVHGAGGSGPPSERAVHSKT